MLHAQKSVLQILRLRHRHTCTTHVDNDRNASNKRRSHAAWTRWTWFCPLSLVLKRNLHLCRLLFWTYHRHRKAPVCIVTMVTCFNTSFSCVFHSTCVYKRPMLIWSQCISLQTANVESRSLGYSCSIHTCLSFSNSDENSALYFPLHNSGSRLWHPPSLPSPPHCLNLCLLPTMCPAPPTHLM